MRMALACRSDRRALIATIVAPTTEEVAATSVELSAERLLALTHSRPTPTMVRPPVGTEALLRLAKDAAATTAIEERVRAWCGSDIVNDATLLGVEGGDAELVRWVASRLVRRPEGGAFDVR